jgi:hypothetical protein
LVRDFSASVLDLPPQKPKLCLYNKSVVVTDLVHRMQVPGQTAISLYKFADLRRVGIWLLHRLPLDCVTWISGCRHFITS